MNMISIAWNNALICIANGYPKSIWLAPIDDNLKDALWNKAEKYYNKQKALKREPLLFGGHND